MYAPDAMHGSQMQAEAHEPERRQMDQTEARHGFRPLALPALAAAAQARKAGTKPTPNATRAIVHEDTPLD